MLEFPTVLTGLLNDGEATEQILYYLYSEILAFNGSRHWIVRVAFNFLPLMLAFLFLKHGFGFPLKACSQSASVPPREGVKHGTIIGA